MISSISLEIAKKRLTEQIMTRQSQSSNTTISRWIRRATQTASAFIPDRRRSADTLNFEGILRIREIPPEWTDAEFRHWWCDEYSPSGMLIRRAAMSEREKDRWTAWEGKNMLMSAGRTQILTFMGQLTAPATFSQQYAVGTGTIYTVQPSDTSLASELFRLAPTSFSIVGNAVTVTTTFSTSQGNGNWTNAGLYGISASSTANSGVLMTHILCNYNKTNANPITSDYTMSLT